MSSPSPKFSVDSNASPVSPARIRGAFPFPLQDVASVQYTSRQMSRRGSTSSTLSVCSIGGSLDAQNLRSSAVRETAQNAISTLLQPPIVRTGLIPHTQASAAAAGFKAPTTKDIPPVTLTNIPHVPPENFRDYLNRISPLFESFQRGRVESEQSQWQRKDQDLEKADRLAEQLEGKLSGDASATPTISRQTSATSLRSPTESSPQPKRRTSAQFRRNRHEPTPLSTIPSVYFDEDFHLENPRTFDVVSERSEIVRAPFGASAPERQLANGTPHPPRKALATNAILQEKLSWYMDTVEVHLINSISAASSSFFAALGSLKELQTEAEESVAKIQRLRQDLQRLDRDVAVSGLEVAVKRRRRENVRKLHSATAQVQRVVENVRKTDELVDKGAYDDAADQLSIAGRLICGQQEHGQDQEELIDLRPLKALQGLDSGLQELQLRIGTGFALRFTTILLNDLRRHVAEVPAEETLKRWSRQRGIRPIYMETSEQLRADLLTALKGLSKAGHTAPATASYREAVNKEMKSLIRKHLPSSSDDDTDSMVSISTRGGKQLTQQDKSSILARNLRALDAQDAQKLLVNIYTSVGEALRRVSTQTKILLDVTSSMQAPEAQLSPQTPRAPNQQSVGGRATTSTETKMQEELSQALDMSSLLGHAVDTAQTQITRVLKVRNEQSIRLSKQLFIRYFTLNRLFADECEAVSGRSGNVLKGIINTQISGFVQVLGTAETERIARLLDNDTWNAEDFSDRSQILLQRILASMSSDPPEWTTSAAPLWQEPSLSRHVNGDDRAAEGQEVHDTPNGTPQPTKKETKPAYIDESRYILVGSATSLLETIDTFLSLTTTLPTMTPQICTSLLDVLRTFNSRSCQLILGAGATRSAGLKNITTKHLALASQALSFVVALVPYVRECARRHMPSGQGVTPLAEFDKTKRLYQDHQSGIHDKLVEIMTSRSQAHVKAMRGLRFDDQDASAAGIATDDKPSQYMETLTKETLTLHRVLARHLGVGDVGMIMRQIAANYRDQWTKGFGEVQVHTQPGGRRLLRDAEAFEARLGKIEGFAEIGREIMAVVTVRISDVAGNGKKEEKKIEEKEEERGKDNEQREVKDGEAGSTTPTISGNGKAEEEKK